MKNKQATSTVTGIIDGMGSLGTAFGQFLIAKTTHQWGWQYGYLLVICISIACTLIPLSKTLMVELKEI